MTCPICRAAMEFCFSAEVLGKYEAQYEVCKSCGFLRARDPYWLSEAYAKAIAVADTGLVARNVALASKVAAALYWVVGGGGGGRCLDAAGGHGMLTRLMRDLGFDFYWSDKYCKNLLATGFEFSDAMAPCNAATAMEVLEHLTDPAEFIKETLELSGAQTLLFTTELYEGSPPKPGEWWYYAFPTGQHIGFFQRRTLAVLAESLGLHFASANGLHIFSRSKIGSTRLRVVTSPWVAPFASTWIRRRLGSKTMSDHYKLLDRIGE